MCSNWAEREFFNHPDPTWFLGVWTQGGDTKERRYLNTETEEYNNNHFNCFFVVISPILRFKICYDWTILNLTWGWSWGNLRQQIIQNNWCPYANISIIQFDNLFNLLRILWFPNTGMGWMVTNIWERKLIKEIVAMGRMLQWPVEKVSVTIMILLNLVDNVMCHKLYIWSQLPHDDSWASLLTWVQCLCCTDRLQH